MKTRVDNKSSISYSNSLQPTRALSDFEPDQIVLRVSESVLVFSKGMESNSYVIEIS